MDDTGDVSSFVVSTPATRRICNDPRCLGLDYTRGLSSSCADVLQAAAPVLDLVERETAVVNILRGGLNYGLREALGAAYGWNVHATCFLSAQRAKDSDGGDWHITENSYRKLRFPRNASLVIGDVVATGTSLVYALDELIATAQKGGTIVMADFFLLKKRVYAPIKEAALRAVSPAAVIAWVAGSVIALGGFDYLPLGSWAKLGLPAVNGMVVAAAVYCVAVRKSR